MNENAQNKILPLRHKAKNGGVIVVPNWSDHTLFLHLCDFVRDNPEYAHLGQVDYNVPKVNKGLESENPHNAGPTIDELADAYGSNAIKKAHKLAEDKNASLALLFSKRGYGQLGITASFYGKTR